MKKKFFRIITAVLMAAVSLLPVLPTNAVWLTIGGNLNYPSAYSSTVSNFDLGQYVNSGNNVITGVSFYPYNSGTYNLTIRIDNVIRAIKQVTIVGSNNLTEWQIQGYSTGTVPVSNGQTVKISLDGISGNAIKVGTNASAYCYRVTGYVGDISVVRTVNPLINSGSIYLQGQIQYISSFESYVDTLISVKDSDNVTLNYTTGRISRIDLNYGYFGVKIPLSYLSNGNYEVNSYLIGNFSQTQSGTALSFSVNHSSQGVGYGNITTQNGTQFNITENAFNESGNASISIFGPRFTTYINATSIGENQVISGAILTRLATSDSSGNLSLHIWSDNTNITLSGDDVNPIRLATTWKTKITGLTSNTTYHIQAEYVGSFNPSVTYTTNEVIFTTKIAGQGNPGAGDVSNGVPGIFPWDFTKILNDANMNNTAGKLAVVLTGMVITAGIFWKDRKLRAVIPCVIGGLGVITGWVPIALTILIVLFASLIIWSNFRKHASGSAG